MRIILLILTLAVCFLAGVLYGVDSEPSIQVDNIEQEAEIEVDNIVTEVSHEPSEESITIVETATTTPAYEAASALETIVDFLFEIVVDILLHISQLFF